MEPSIRSHTIMCDLIHTVSQNPENLEVPTDGIMLAEDIQLGLCSLQSRLWHWSMKSEKADFTTRNELSGIIKNMDAWKRHLDRIEVWESDACNFQPKQHWAMRFYYGMESHTENGWQNVVFYRQKSLVCDGIALYHLSKLQAYSNLRILSQLSKDIKLGKSPEGRGEMYQKVWRKREIGTKEWANSSNARRALSHAAAILGFYNELPTYLRQGIDPIIYVALSSAALVVWAYTSFARHNCETCSVDSIIGPQAGALPIVELTTCCRIAVDSTLVEKVLWVDEGHGCVSIRGIFLCRCNLSPILLMFKSTLPEDWDVAHTIAPEILQQPDAATQGESVAGSQS